MAAHFVTFNRLSFCLSLPRRVRVCALPSLCLFCTLVLLCRAHTDNCRRIYAIKRARQNTAAGYESWHTDTGTHTQQTLNDNTRG